jgi:dihydroxy-acid dehydratase
VVLDVPNRRLEVEADLTARPVSAAASAAFAAPSRGWQRLYVEHVMQADRGVDLDFLAGGGEGTPTRESH